MGDPKCKNGKSAIPNQKLKKLLIYEKTESLAIFSILKVCCNTAVPSFFIAQFNLENDFIPAPDIKLKHLMKLYLRFEENNVPLVPLIFGYSSFLVFC